MTDSSTCNRAAKFRLDAYDTSNFPTDARNLTCREHLAATIIVLEEQLAELDDNDTLCVTVLDEPTRAELRAKGEQLYARPALSGTLAAGMESASAR